MISLESLSLLFLFLFWLSFSMQELVALFAGKDLLQCLLNLVQCLHVVLSARSLRWTLSGGKLHFSNFELPALSWVWLMTCWAKLQARACLRIGSEHFTSLVNWCQQLLVVYFSLSVMQEKAIWLVYSVFQSLLIMTILKRLALSRELFWMENDFLAAFGLSAQAKKVMMVLLCTTSRSSWHKWSLISYG